jgi:predicted acetyltransferase
MSTSKASLPMRLVWPSSEYLPGYIRALERGWSPDNLRHEAAQEELELIFVDPAQFLEQLIDREAKGSLITLPNGTTVAKLPGYRRWLWDGDFCGSIGLRWQRGSNELPDYCPGHIGYSVVPWKSSQGYATAALRSLLLDAPGEGLAYVDITTSPDNLASQRVIQANGGVFIETFVKPPETGGTPELRFRITV